MVDLQSLPRSTVEGMGHARLVRQGADDDGNVIHQFWELESGRGHIVKFGPEPEDCEFVPGPLHSAMRRYGYMAEMA